LSHSTTYIEQYRCQGWLISSALSEMFIRQHNNMCMYIFSLCKLRLFKCQFCQYSFSLAQQLPQIKFSVQ
jgi:hypothetical protein